MQWTDVLEIAIALDEVHPAVDPARLRFTDLHQWVMALPGFGKQKAQIFVALLAKQLGVRPDGWQSVVGDYALEGHRSVADGVDGASLRKVRDFKKDKKAAAKAQAQG